MSNDRIPEHRTVDVVVLGGGPAGENVAATTARHGLTTVLVERDLVGGECSYWGCMPSKALLRPTEALAALQRVPGAAAAVTGEIDVGAVLRSRDAFAAGWDDTGQVEWLDDNDVELVRGTARLAGARTVSVTDDEGSTMMLVARHAVVVATGSSAAWPPIPGLREIEAYDNRGITTLQYVPRSLLVIGGGVIGVEMAQAWKRLGSTRVHVVEIADRLLLAEEPSVGDEIANALRADGVTLHLAVGVTAVSRPDSKVVVTLSNGGTIEVDEVLVATGRRPNSEDLGLESVGLEPGAWLTTDDQLRVDGVEGGWLFAVGDVNGRSLLTHMGKYQARAAGDVIGGIDASAWADRATVPRVVFTDPQVGAVGLTELEATDRGLDVEVVEYDIGDVAGTSVLGRGYHGTCRIIVDRDRDVLVGATFVGPTAGELVHSATIAIAGQVTTEQLWHAVPAFPTSSEVWLRLLEALRSSRGRPDPGARSARRSRGRTGRSPARSG